MPRLVRGPAELRAFSLASERRPERNATPVIELTATFFDLRGQWTPPTKRRPAQIADLDPGLHGLLTAMYADGASFKDQLALARRMLPLIYDEAST
jgi:hypothetical protein